MHEFGTRLEGIDYIDRPGVYAVMENSLKMIAVVETGSGYFLPGGGIEPGESELEALKREVLEETGYQISTVAEIGEAVEYIKAHSEEKYYRLRSRFYKVNLNSKAGNGIETDHRLVWLCQADAIERLTRQSQAWAIRSMAEE